MNPSRCGFLTVPNLQPNVQVTGFVRAPETRALRVLVLNTGPTTLRLAFDSSSLAAASTDCFFLPVGQQIVLVIAPKQMVYVVSVGPGGQLSFAASEAVPQQDL